MNDIKSVTVFCGSSLGNDASFQTDAENLALAMANRKYRLIYGAAKIGVMGAIAKTALEKGVEVIGVIPKFLMKKEVVHMGLDDLIVVETMHQRKTIMSDMADAFIVLPGGYGTMEEFFEVLTWAQLGLHAKPIAILNTGGYFDHLLSFIDIMVDKNLLKDINRSMVIVDTDVESLLDKIEHYEAPLVEKWLTGKDVT